MEHNFGLKILQQSVKNANRTAIQADGKSYQYQQLLADASNLVNTIAPETGLEEQRVAFLFPNGYEYVTVMWAIWMAGGIAVPLCISHPEAELDYVISDSQPSIILASPALSKKLVSISEKRNVKLLVIDNCPVNPGPKHFLNVAPSAGALMIYTSGTSGKPKGAVLTHGCIEAQVLNMQESWNWEETDKTLLVLPLHHIHGIVNILLTCLWTGACCEIMNFDAQKVWDKLSHPEEGVTTFHAVPTIYAKLIDAYETWSPEEKARATKGISALKLMVSGSMALPAPLFSRWEAVSGHRLLERYGTTEVGMSITNPFSPASERIPGRVGKPFSRTQVKLKPSDETEPNIGEILIKGQQVFRGYFNRDEATKNAFTEDGWYMTGDIGQLHDDGTYSILGRSNIDILKSGGYKISALEVEREFLGFSNDIKDTAVIGIDDITWGQRLHCFVVLREGAPQPTTEELVNYGKKQLAPYKVPRTFQFLSELPKNVMGKTQKNVLHTLVK